MTGIIDKDSAVSAVVGVMLMLAVTIIIASVISAYVGGLAPNKESAPQVSVVARVNETNLSYIYFDHMGGDGFGLDDLTIIIDQGDQTLRITEGTIQAPGELFNKGGNNFVRPGDTIVLQGKVEGDSTNITSGASYILIEHDHEFTWTLLSQRSNAIIARGTLALIQ
jgi:FlaG/FlaF family flagellin (archaellin)